jgi:hypothetical protein
VTFLNTTDVASGGGPVCRDTREPAKPNRPIPVYTGNVASHRCDMFSCDVTPMRHDIIRIYGWSLKILSRSAL